MDELTWEALLPPIFATAGIDAGGALEIAPLTGGVSSDIVRIRLDDGRQYCAKRALGKLKVATDWHTAANKPNTTPVHKEPWVFSQTWVSLSRRPQTMATITPETSKLPPTKVQPQRVSPKNNQASKVENKACEANSTPLRRGPSRFMQANKAVSPMKIPIKPDKASKPTLAPSRVRHCPVKAVKAHSKVRAKNKRQRVKANAPMRLDAAAENKLPTAHDKAASAAKSSACTGQPGSAARHLHAVDQNGAGGFGPHVVGVRAHRLDAHEHVFQVARDGDLVHRVGDLAVFDPKPAGPA